MRAGLRYQPGDVRMKILMIGGTGNISSAVTERLAAAGHEVHILTRGSDPAAALFGASLIRADIEDEAAARAALGTASFDVVVDWIVFTPEQAARDVRLFSGRTKQYVFISSASAYQKPPSRYLVTEETPLENPFWDYSRNKIACEHLLMEAYRRSGFPATIVRPSLTYGDRIIPYVLGSWEKPWSLIDRLRRGKPVIVPGDGTSLWTVTHNSDFAAGFVGILDKRRAIGEAFHITSDEVLTWNAILGCIGEAARAAPNIVHIPSDFIASILPDQTGNLFGDKMHSTVFDNRKIKAFVPGFAAVLPFREGIARTVAFLDSRPDLQIVDADHEARIDALLAAYGARADS
jgi:nucleoside-diphosphate-sugar epimerase